MPVRRARAGTERLRLVLDATPRRGPTVIEILALLVIFEVLAIGSALRARGRARRARRPSRHDESIPEPEKPGTASGRWGTARRAPVAFGALVFGVVAALLLGGPVLAVAAAVSAVTLHRVRWIAAKRG